MSPLNAVEAEADAAFQNILVPPSRFWAILFGDAPTEVELRYIRERDYLRRQAEEVLTQRNDPRVEQFRASRTCDERVNEDPAS